MIIKLVSCSCVDNMQYYDAIVCSNNNWFFLTNVYYNVSIRAWSIKLPNRPLFTTFLIGDVFNYLSEYLRDVFYR